MPRSRPGSRGILPICPVCIATGRCSTCDGRGWLEHRRDDGTDRPLPCTACQGSGRCVFCKGRGKLISPA